MLSPGDPQAREEGCTCPSDINREGKGASAVMPNQDQSKTFFVIERDCPMHGMARS